MSEASYQHSIHCLSNGSECTDPTLLLTIERGTNFCHRYALSGVTSLTARLAADQKVALRTIQACFVVSGKNNIGGLSSLLLCQHDAGVGELTVCSNDSKQVESIVSLTLDRRPFPLVRTCQVPMDGKWYQMYQDEFVLAFGKYVNGEIFWIYSLLKKQSGPTCVLVLPRESCMSAIKPLPEQASDQGCIILLEKPNVTDGMPNGMFYTNGRSETSDSKGLLMRASNQAERLAEKFPFCVSYRRISSATEPEPRELVTCSRLRLDDDEVGDDEDAAALTIDDSYRKSREERCGLYDDEIEWGSHEDIEAAWSVKASLKDSNEIDLGDDDENDDEAATVDRTIASDPRLLVLGTGCATPAALRGSSGYALLTPRDKKLVTTAIIECGEGALTNLRRHLPERIMHDVDPLATIRFIWISHAHLDHYGGLPDLVAAMYKAQGPALEHLEGDRDEDKGKRLKLMLDTPVIIAPSKVLEFLRASLDDTINKWYRAANHGDFHKSPFAQDMRDYVHVTGQLVSVPVEHCPQAFGMMLTLTCNGFRLCYSGDTRPSNRLIRACQDVTLLIHEASFDDTDRRQAVQKKHSTVSEALDVAKRMNAQACLLTHFSQRYPKSPPASANAAANAAFAVDGLMIPLTLAAVKKLPTLSRLIQQALVEQKTQPDGCNDKLRGIVARGESILI